MRNHPRSGEVLGVEVLHLRNNLEAFLVLWLPKILQRPASEILTRITGLAPSASLGIAIWKGSETRAVIYEIAALLLGVACLMHGGPILVLGSALMIFAMRNFSSSVGHHLTHSAAHLPWSKAWTEMVYDALSSVLLLASYDGYRVEHGRHHAHVGGPGDPDEEFINWLGARFDGPIALVRTLSSFSFHASFFVARMRNAIATGPVWRRALGAASIIAVASSGWKGILLWTAVMVIGYQTASLMSWLSLHLWSQRPVKGNPFEVATAVTFGRLLIPETSFLGLLKLPFYAAVRALWLQGDLPNHDLHHIGRGPWTEAPYVRTRLLLDGIPLRQTVSLRAMFALPMKKRNAGSRQEPLNPDHLLQM